MAKEKHGDRPCRLQRLNAYVSFMLRSLVPEFSDCDALPSIGGEPMVDHQAQ
jgi:hypothetical protein